MGEFLVLVARRTLGFGSAQVGLGWDSELDRSKPQGETRNRLVSGAETGRPADHQRYFLDGKKKRSVR